MKIVHLTTSHPRYDVRIFVKQCRALATHHNTTLLVADGLGDEHIDGVKIVDTGRAKSRWDKLTGVSGRLYRKVRELRPDAVHFHDGVFLPWAVALSLGGYKVIYDVHEDYPRQVMNWRFAWPIRRAASIGYTILEWIGARTFARIVPATPHIADRFPRGKTTVVRNYPILRSPEERTYGAFRLAYVGGIAPVRGYHEMVSAIQVLNRRGIPVHLDLAGPYQPPLTGDEPIEPFAGRIRYHGVLDRSGVSELLASAGAGLCVLHPAKNYLEALPVKLFEYMEAGLPVIASNFPLWREIVEGNDCGICVDPLDPAAIAAAIDRLTADPEEAARMGANGRRAVEEHYNWSVEEKALLALYERLVN